MATTILSYHYKEFSHQNNVIGKISSTAPAASTPDEIRWSKVNTPTEGESGNWVLASGPNIQHRAKTTDGTIYVYADPSTTSLQPAQSTFPDWVIYITVALLLTVVILLVTLLVLVVGIRRS